MAHLVTPFFFTFYAVIQANSKSVKIAENTFLEAKRQQYTLGKVVHRLFNINLIHSWRYIACVHRLAIYCWYEFKANSFTKKQIVWVTCGMYNHEGMLFPGSKCPGQYGGVELLVWIFHRSQSQSLLQYKPNLSLIVPKKISRKDYAV